MVDCRAVVVVAFILHFSCKLGLTILEGWIPQTTLGWSQETQAGACTKSWCSYSQLVLKKSAKIEVFHTQQLIVLDGFYQ